MKNHLLLFTLTLLVFSSCENTGDKTIVSIKADEFYINGKPTLEGKTWRDYSIQGLLPNVRMVQGIYDDLNPETVDRWAYPDTKTWDANRNTKEFIEAMPLWKENGLLAFTINLQGGSPEGYSETQPWHNSAISEKGELRLDYMNRLKQILTEADRLGMVAIVGVYYFGQERRMESEESIKNGLVNTVDWILENNFQNVLLEVCNESSFLYSHSILQEERVHELINLAKSRQVQGKSLLVGTSFLGNHIPTDTVAAVSDFILIHGNGIKKWQGIVEQVNKIKALKSYKGQPIVYNEDDHEGFDQPKNNFVTATSQKVSWGYFDYRRKGEAFECGYQNPPVDWGINSPRKKAFFKILSEWK
ncbi:hypothetical protein [Ancylomarina sp. 16SWW S1-10-2]|uniref:hypothetical protein n=1 Tax=Ancylomarina sp. 16SWW S1-10-2 TaxID=2499681 RepID=UPI0012AD80F8|nr:hypothetical protein [Ancylomarina sp. 16SWW S1-10-2]MRT91612.1 hypothetical protein [Ancylomarina sp. 16SWW S1-10-2]